MLLNILALQVAGYLLAMTIGFSLGLIGGGGSILTIPVLVFFFFIDPVSATTYSLFIVGITAICGSIHHYRMRNVDFKTVGAFGIPSVLVLIIVRHWLLAMIPYSILQLGGWNLTKPLLVMILFSILMLLCGWYMIRGKALDPAHDKQSPGRLAIQGAITGAVTGFIGIGGGFIIVPSLVLFAGLPMKRAIGTSLTIITLNCLVGILANWAATASLDYLFLASFSAFAIIGILLGTRLIRYVPDKKLKPIFGGVILIMSIVVFIRIILRHY